MADSCETKPIVYWYPTYRSTRVMWLLKELEVDSEYKFIRYKKDEEFLGINPHGTVPVLVIQGETPYIESGAICMNLADKYNKLLPDEKHKWEYNQMIIYATATLDEVFVFFTYLWLLKVEFTQTRIDHMRKKCNTCMQYLSDKLKDRLYLLGDKFTAADCILGYDIFLGKLLHDGELIEDFPVVKEYYGRISARPAFQITFNME